MTVPFIGVCGLQFINFWKVQGTLAVSSALTQLSISGLSNLSAMAGRIDIILGVAGQ